MTRPNNVATDYTYDNLSRLLSVLHKLSGGTIDGASYTVDAVGNRTAKANLLPSAPTENYTYDAIYQLTQVAQAGPTTTESYSYDAVGNRLSSLAASPWNYNVSNQLTSIAGSPGTTFTYDNNGNTTSKTDATGTTTYTWDYENQLTSVILPGSGGTVSFTYDPFGRRTRKLTPTGTTVFAYDENSIIEETAVNGTVVARYAHGMGVDEPLAALQNFATHFYQADGLGSVTSLTDSTGSVAASYTYDTFGNTIVSSGAIFNRFRYTGRESDPEFQALFYRSRYYSPTSGRFLSEDQIGFSGGANFFAYAFNEPVSQVDPFGFQSGGKQTVKDVANWARGTLSNKSYGAGDAATTDLMKTPVMDQIRKKFKDSGCKDDLYCGDYQYRQLVTTWNVTGQAVGSFCARITNMGGGLVSMQAQKYMGLGVGDTAARPGEPEQSKCGTDGDQFGSEQEHS